MASLMLQVVSDIHLEKRVVPFEHILKPSADVLALVGDIGSPFRPGLAEFIDWCASRFHHVFYVPGNHEYYNTNMIPVEEINSRLANICNSHSNVHFLYNTVKQVGKYAFIGSVLWSHVPDEHTKTIQNMMNDYKYIFKMTNNKESKESKVDIETITVSDTNAEYQKNKVFIEQAVADARANNLTPIVLTHHTPSMHMTSSPRLTGGVSCFAFSSTLSCPPGIIRLWACGHTHYNFHHHQEGYELVSNQWGYGDIGVKNYKPNMSILL